MSDSKKVLIEKVVVGALLVVLVGALVYSNRRGQENVGVSAASPEEASVINIALAKERLSAMTTRREAIYNKETIRNPLKMPAEVASIELGRPVTSADKDAKTSDKYVLEGLIVNEKENLAIISGTVVGVGEVLNGAKVESIDKAGVVLSKGGSKIELKR